MKDCLGNEILIGNFVVCAMRYGDKCELAQADVIDVFPNKIKVQRRGFGHTGFKGNIKYKPSVWSHSNRIMVIK